MSDKTEAFLHSQTRENLMRAFAGESQARNRYTIAAGVANKAGLAVIQGVFLFTAEQERVHAKQFYSALEDCAGQTVKVDGTYPVDIYSGVLDYLRAAQHNVQVYGCHLGEIQIPLVVPFYKVFVSADRAGACSKP